MEKNKRLSVLILLFGLPDDNSFLTSKFIGLSQYMDVDIVAWDPSKNRKKHLEGLRKKGFQGNIHLSPTKFNVFTVLSFLFSNLPVAITKFGTIRRFIKEGKTVLGKDIFKKLFFDFYLIRSKHDVWHWEFGAGAGAGGYYYLKNIFPHKKMSVSFRGYDLNYVGLANADYYKNTWQQFDGFHFLGEDLKNRAVKRGYTGNKIEAIIPPAIDISFFSPNGKTAQQPADKLVIVSVGRLVWKKGFEYGVRAMAILKEKGIPFEYRIIGDGDFLQPIEFAITELGLQDNVKLLGKKTKAQIKDQLSEADVFLHPAISEGFCNAVLEAQAMGLPVICTDADGLPENVVDNETGFVVPKWDVQAMADKLEWCYHNKAQAKQMGEKGIERVAAHFKLEDQVRSFANFYQTLHES